MPDFSALLEGGGLRGGARVYLCPTFLDYAPGFGVPLLGGACRAAAFRILGRLEGARLVDESVSAEALPALLDEWPQAIAARLKAQFEAMSLPRTALSFTGDMGLAFTRPRVMGVVNVTPDSFSDGGDHASPEAAIAHAHALIAAGADILDIGGESTRPGADPVWEGEEIDRVVPVIAALAGVGVPLSVDTRKASVMRAALDAGAHLVNDVSALTYDPNSLGMVAEAGVPVVLMHAQGDPRTMQNDPRYDDVLLDVYDHLQQRIKAAEAAGVRRADIIIDPGFGFGKRVVADNMALLRGLALFHTLGVPVLAGLSRKRFIGAVTGVEEAKGRLSGSLAGAILCMQLGAQILRVHDVAETREAASLVQAFADSALMDLPGANG